MLSGGTQERTQAVRPVPRDGHSSATSPVSYIPCQLDAVSGKHIVLWENIQSIFKDALFVRQDSMTLPLLKDANFKTIRPLRVLASPEMVLEVVIEGQLVDTRAASTGQVQLSSENKRNPEFDPAGVMSQSVPQQTRPAQHPQLDPFTAAIPSNTSTTTTSRAPQIISDSGEGIYDHSALIQALSLQPSTNHLSPNLHPNENNNKPTTDTLNTTNAINTSSTSTRTAAAPQGSPVSKQYPRPLDFYLDRANRGFPKAQHTMACVYQQGLAGIKQDYRKALEWYLKAADQGLLESIHNIGSLYQEGHPGIPRDYNKAMEWYLKAADKGLAPSQYKIGSMYRLGQGVPKDEAKALEWYLKAAHQGEKHSQYNVGLFYRVGQGTQQDFGLAREWFLKSANNGHNKAKTALGMLYHYGQGVQKDYQEAMRWYTQTTEDPATQDVFAMNNIGVLYRDGLGVAQDYSKALGWYHKAAGRGHVTGQYNLGMMYEDGLGVFKDHVKAAEWYRKAAEQGHVDAQKALKRLGVGVMGKIEV